MTLNRQSFLCFGGCNKLMQIIISMTLEKVKKEEEHLRWRNQWIQRPKSEKKTNAERCCLNMGVIPHPPAALFKYGRSVIDASWGPCAGANDLPKGCPRSCSRSLAGCWGGRMWESRGILRGGQLFLGCHVRHCGLLMLEGAGLSEDRSQMWGQSW